MSRTLGAFALFAVSTLPVAQSGNQASGSAVTPAPSPGSNGPSTGAGLPNAGFTKNECAFQPVTEWVPEYRAAIESGEVRDPRDKIPPPIPVGNPRGGIQSSTFSSEHIYPFEDTNRLLLTNFSCCQLYELMADAANEVIATHGDNFQFFSFFINFTPDHQIGAAFYRSIKNDTLGIRSNTFDFHNIVGLDGQAVEGMIMFWDINDMRWQPGDTLPGSLSTRQLFAHEFGHRWVCHLPQVKGVEVQSGTVKGCGNQGHWDDRVDNQGDVLEVSDWSGSNPAYQIDSGLSFNIETGGAYSWTDLYLMGYASRAEMDANNIEFRYMNGPNCDSPYSGSILELDSSDIVAAVGPRVPDYQASPKYYRTAWVMIHLPGAAPTQAELDKAVGIVEQQAIDFNEWTLGRGQMSHELYIDSGVSSVYGCGVNPAGSMQVLSGEPSLTTPIVLGVHNPLGTQASGSLPFVVLSQAAADGFPCGKSINGYGMAGPGAAGELLIDIAKPFLLDPIFLGGLWNGASPSAISLRFPADNSLLGATFYAQGAILDLVAAGGVKYGMADAVELRVGP